MVAVMPGKKEEVEGGGFEAPRSSRHLNKERCLAVCDSFFVP